jgi:hypothetical protein
MKTSWDLEFQCGFCFLSERIEDDFRILPKTLGLIMALLYRIMAEMIKEEQYELRFK